ncbi:hypothetical protein B9Z51_02275 [Limnohabitans sp. T6-5]|nr:hypothetical protein B9Z51_02275 [Limnohabitans sp. T6-5]
MWAALLSLLHACTAPPTATAPETQSTAQTHTGGTLRETLNSGAAASSIAHSAKEYRVDAASHLYGLNKQRIYKGRLPPMLMAVGVLDVDIDHQGKVKALKWKRAPNHAPQVMAEIERLVKAAAPYPTPRNLSQVTYTDVWLWHQSGQFQLDTLTEGQD